MRDDMKDERANNDEGAAEGAAYAPSGSLLPEKRGRALSEAYERLRFDHPGIRAREAAAMLGVSEAELVACRTGNGVIRLRDDFEAILKGLTSLGEVMALTRNDHCVHEKHGVYDKISIGPGHGLVLNHDIDLRLFMSHWRFGFAVREEAKSGVRSSLQFFDIDGSTIHKIYLTDASNRGAHDALIERFRAGDQSDDLCVTPLPSKPPERPDSEIDTRLFRAHWANLQDTHDFFGLLQEFGVTRLQAMRLAGTEFAHQVAPEGLRMLMEQVAAEQTPIMCFVGNPGCIQIHTGPVQTLKVMGPWFNILDPRFNLHLREDAIASAWVVKKPTRDGIVTSLELFDRHGYCFVQFFGERKPGKAELDAWRRAIDALPPARARAA